MTFRRTPMRIHFHLTRATLRVTAMRESSLTTSKLHIVSSCRISLSEMDTTLMSELEYINILPDMELDDSSFLKGSFVNSAAARADKSQEDAAIKTANEE